MAFIQGAVLGVRPLWLPQYFVPLLGCLMGNIISGISLGLTTLLEEFLSDHDQLEVSLAMGATRWEACESLVQRSLVAALTPMMNQMSVVGLVSVPGLMAGMLLQGASPLQAAVYQVILMGIIGMTALCCSALLALMSLLRIVDSCHRFVPGCLKRTNRDSGIVVYVESKLASVANACVSFCMRVFHVCCQRRPRQRWQALRRDPDRGLEVNAHMPGSHAPLPMFMGGGMSSTSARLSRGLVASVSREPSVPHPMMHLEDADDAGSSYASTFFSDENDPQAPVIGMSRSQGSGSVQYK